MIAPLLVGIYIDPSIWFEAAPAGLPADPDQTTTAMRDIVFRSTLAGSIAVEATREGLIAFDLSTWAPAFEPAHGLLASIPTTSHTAVLNRAMLLNAFLAFFYTYEDRRGAIHQRTFVTPEVLVRLISLTASVGGFSTSEGFYVSHLVRSSDLATYDPTRPFDKDPRILFRRYPDFSNVIPTSTLANTLAALEAVLADPQTDGLLLTELFHRASKSYQDHNFSTSLIINWAIAEKILREMWSEYLATNRERDGATFINHDRMTRLKRSREYTAAVITETLSLNGILDLALYNHLNEVRHVRNQWMHGLDRAISAEAAYSSAQLAEKMLLRGRHIDLHAQTVISWGG